MALEFPTEIEIIEVMEGYLVNARPPEEIRSQIDIGYKVEDQSIVLYEIRPSWSDKSVLTETPIAKCTYVKKSESWKIFWFKSDMKWHSYKPHSIALSLKEFVAVVEDDEHGCFWG